MAVDLNELRKRVLDNQNYETLTNSTHGLQHVCGLIMPISEIDGLSKTHWDEVKNVISEAISSVGFKPNLVSDSKDIGVIHKRIVQNLYDNPIVVCDVSAKNPNVMFELGLRLAFDKPTIIIKDDETNYSFDTSPIEHLEYPRDLRFGKVIDFKNKLAKKILDTFNESNNDKDYSTFLKHFGTFNLKESAEEAKTQKEQFLVEIKAIKKLLMEELNSQPRNFSDQESDDDSEYALEEISIEDRRVLEKMLASKEINPLSLVGSVISIYSSIVNL